MTDRELSDEQRRELEQQVDEQGFGVVMHEPTPAELEAREIRATIALRPRFRCLPCPTCGSWLTPCQKPPCWVRS